MQKPIKFGKNCILYYSSLILISFFSEIRRVARNDYSMKYKKDSAL